MSTTPPRTPPSGPTTSASELLDSPHTSRFLLTRIGSSFGGAPTNFTTPATTPPSLTSTSSYAAPAGAAKARASVRNGTSVRTLIARRAEMARIATSTVIGVNQVFQAQPEAATPAKEPHGEQQQERNPDGELRAVGQAQPVPEQEVPAHGDDRAHRVVDVDGAHEVSLRPLELQSAEPARRLHREPAPKQRRLAAAGAAQPQRPQHDPSGSGQPWLRRHGSRQCLAGAEAAGFLPPLVWWWTANPSGSSTKMSRVAMTSGTIAMSPSVRTSKRRCMKYMATIAALPRARATSSTPMVNLASGMKITISSMTVRAASHQKMAM